MNESVCSGATGWEAVQRRCWWSDESADDDDEAGYRFASHAFRPGEYVSIRDEDGEMHTFQVVSVEAA